MVRAFPAEFLYTIVHNNEHMFKSMNILGTPTFETLVFLGRHYRNSYYVRELAKILTIVPVLRAANSGHWRNQVS